MPRSLGGVITQEEFTAYVKFQQSLREEPEIEELNTQIRAKINEVMEMQKKVQLAQQKAVEANPEMKAIVDKIMKSRQRPPAGAALHPGALVVAPVPAHAAAATTPAGPTATPK